MSEGVEDVARLALEAEGVAMTVEAAIDALLTSVQGRGVGVLGTHVDALALVLVVGTSDQWLAVRADEHEVGLTGRAVVIRSTGADRAGRVAEEAGVVGGVEIVIGSADALRNTEYPV